MKNLRKYISLIVVITQFFWSISGYANPTGGNIVSGSATIGTSGNTLTVNQTSNQLITNWQSFSIAAGQTTQFIQPSSSSVALNRVVGSSPSDIYGALLANGKVFLINKNGILFAPGSNVNVGGLLASTLNISNKQFLKGQYYTINANGQLVAHNGYYFNGAIGFGSVINRGTININAPGGYAALLGATVGNSGTITTSAGTVVLASGKAIAVNLDSAGRISAVVPQGGTGKNRVIGGIFNTGTIRANGGTVILTAQSLNGLIKNLINNDGIIEANTVNINSNGNISLSGDIAAGSGGVDVSGNSININNATITSAPQPGHIVGLPFQPVANTPLLSAPSIPGNGDVSIAGNTVNINNSTIASSSTDGHSSVDIQYNNGTNINNSQISAQTTDRQVIPNLSNSANVTIAGNGVANITGSTIKATINTNVSNPSFMTGGTSVNINSSLNAGGQSGVTLNNTQITSSVNGASSKSNNSITAQTNGNNLNGNIQLLNGSTVNAGQNGSGYENLSISGNNIIGDATSSINGFNAVKLSAVGNIGSAASPLNLNVGEISGSSTGVGNIYLKSIGAVTLTSLFAANGLIDVSAGGPLSAENVITGGGAGDSINLTTTSGGIDIGTINAAGGLGDVNLTSAVSITNNSGTGSVTANNFNFTSGNVVGTQAAVRPTVVGGNIVLNIQNTDNGASYNVYASSSPTGPYLLVAGNVAASSGTSTQWTGPAVASAPSMYYIVKVASASNSNVGTSTDPINTNVNSINGQANAGVVGNIYLNQGAKSVALKNLTTASGSINVNSAGSMDVGNINAAGGTSDVTLNSGTTITNNTGTGSVTANNFNFTSGNAQGAQVATTAPVISNGHIVFNIQNTGSVGYNIYSTSSLTGPWVLVATIPATSGPGTQWIGPAATGVSGFYRVTAASPSSVGTSANPINTNVNTINGQANGVGDINLNQAKAVTLADLNAANGQINVVANGKITAENVTTGGGATDSINLKTKLGGIAVGTINAAGGAGDVTLTSAQGITSISTSSLITANNFNFTSGNLVGQAVQGVSASVSSSGNIVLNIPNFGPTAQAAGSYNIYSSASLTGPWQLATTITALKGTTTWTGPAASGPQLFYFVTVGSASSSRVGSTADPLNTNVNTINGQAKMANTGSIFINQAKAVTLANLNAASGSINVTAAGPMIAQNVTTGNGGTFNAINLTTTSGGIDVGTINAAGGSGDVTLNSGTTITNNTGTGSVTANNFNFTSGNAQGAQVATTTPVISNGHIVFNIQNTGSVGYNIYSTTSLTGPWVLVATIPATSGPGTQWIGPAATGVSGFYRVTAASPSSVGTSANPINTNVNTINGQSKGIGDINLNQQSAQAVALKNLTTASGSINVNSAGSMDVGNINAAGGTSDVTLNSGTTITNNTGTGSVTANNFNFTSGNAQGAQVGITAPMIINGHIVFNIQNSPTSTGFNVYRASSITGPWVLVATIPATSGPGTQWIGPAATGVSGFFKATVASASGVGTSTNPINTSVNTINGKTNSIGDVYLNNNKDVVLNSLNVTNGSANVIDSGSIDAQYVQASQDVSLTAGTDIAASDVSAGDTVNLTATNGSIMAMNVPIQGKTVNLRAAQYIGTPAHAAQINAPTVSAVVTGTGGVNLNDIQDVLLSNVSVANGSASVMDTGSIDAQYVQASQDVSLTAGTDIAASDVSAGDTVNLTATNGSIMAMNVPIHGKTVNLRAAQYIGTPAHAAQINAPTVSAVVTGTGGVNLNDIQNVVLNNVTVANGSASVMDTGSIDAQYVQASQDVSLTAGTDINATSITATNGNVTLNSKNGSILGIGGGTNVTSGGDTSLSAGNLIGSWSPYAPLNLNVGGNLTLSIAQRDSSSATGSVPGTMGVSGTLGGTVGGDIIVLSTGPNSYSASTGFIGNPPGYIFLNKTQEIWPNLVLPITPVVTANAASTLANGSIQVSNAIQPIQTVYYEKQKRHLIRRVEVAAPIGVYAYHPSLNTNRSAIDHFKVEPEAYDFIDGRINVNNSPATTLQGAGQKSDQGGSSSNGQQN